MKSKGIIQLWGEFIDLGWSKKLWSDKRDLKDLELFPKVFLRKWQGAWTIHYLPIGTVLTIPPPWPSIWSEFVTWLGGDYYRSTEENNLSVLDRFAQQMIYITSQIDRNLCVGYKYEEFEAALDTLIGIGTGEWSRICKEKWELRFPMWTILDINGTKEV